MMHLVAKSTLSVKLTIIDYIQLNNNKDDNEESNCDAY